MYSFLISRKIYIYIYDFLRLLIICTDKFPTLECTSNSIYLLIYYTGIFSSFEIESISISLILIDWVFGRRNIRLAWQMSYSFSEIIHSNAKSTGKYIGKVTNTLKRKLVVSLKHSNILLWYGNAHQFSSFS